MRTIHAQRLPLRFAMMLCGIFLMGIGIALFSKSNTGISPLASVPFVMSQAFPLLTLGTYTAALNILLFIGQFVLVPKSFSPVQLLQVLPTALLGVSTDLGVWLLAPLSTQGYWRQLLFMGAGCVATALCIGLMVSANVILMPIDGFITQLSNRTGWKWGNTKCFMDVCMVTMACLISLALLGSIVGIREGTLVAAVAVGKLSGLFRPYTDWLATGSPCADR